MLKVHNLKLSKPDAILANDCLLQLEQLGVLDEKSKKRIRKQIKSGSAIHTGHEALIHVHSFIETLFKNKKVKKENKQNPLYK